MTITTSPQYTLVRGCSLMRNHAAGGGYLLGTIINVVAVTSMAQQRALADLALSHDPLREVRAYGDLDAEDEIAAFIESLARAGFLNSRLAQLAPPKRFFAEIDERDLAVLHLRLRATPELAQSEWIDSASDGGVSVISARSLHPVVLSGRSRVISILYSLLLASGVVQVRFSDRHFKPLIDSYDIGCGVIAHDDLGLNYYDRSEAARRGISLFPIEPELRHDVATTKPALIVRYGDCDLEEVVEWFTNRTPHFLIHAPIGDEIAIGPMVLPGKSPCVRCLSLYEIDNFGFTRLERIPINPVDELPIVTAHYIASIAAAQILHYLDSISDSETSRPHGIGEVAYINFQRLTEPQVVAIARHPLCGCDR